MRLTKQFIVKIDFKNVENMYIPQDIAAKRILDSTYCGKTYKGCFITNIKKILRISPSIISDTYIDARATANVMFEADVVVYQKNEILYKCEIFDKKEGKAFSANKCAKIMIASEDKNLINILKKGDKIPIKISAVMYGVMKSFITVFAKPLIPKSETDNMSYIYDVSDSKLNMDEIALLEKYNDELNEILNKVKTFDTTNMKSFKFYSELFYPFRKLKNPKIIQDNKKSSKLIDIQDASKTDIKFIIYAQEISKASSKICIANAIIANDAVKKSSLFTVVEMIIIEKIMFLKFLEEIASDEEYKKANDKYWKIISTYKY